MTKSFESNSNSNESIADNSLVSSFSTSLSISVSVSASASKSISNSASSASAASIKSSSSSSSSDDDFLGGLGNADFLTGLGDLSKDMPSNSSESSSADFLTGLSKLSKDMASSDSSNISSKASSGASATNSFKAYLKSKASVEAHIEAIGAEDSYSDNRYYDVHDGKWGTANLIFGDNGSVDVYDGKISNRPLFNALPHGKANKVKSVTFHDVIAPINCTQLLSNLLSVTKIDLSELDMSNTNNIHDLFADDASLHEVNLISLNTNRITNMSGMFFNDNQVKLLKLGKDTILDDTIEGHINDDYWYETSTGYESFLHDFNIKEPQIFVNDGAPEKINLKNLTLSLIGSYFIKHNKSLANFAKRFKSPVINGDIINPVLETKLSDIQNKLKVYDKCLDDFYVTYKVSEGFNDWCYYSAPLNAKNYSQWKITDSYRKCFDNAVNGSLSINKVKATMTPKKTLKMLNMYGCMIDTKYNHTTSNQNKLLDYLIKHNINAKDALVDVKDEPKFKYITTHDDDKAKSLKIKLKNKISRRNKLQFLHEYFDGSMRVSQLLDTADIPDDLTKGQFLRKVRYDHDLIKKYNIFYNEHRFVGESRASQNKLYYYNEMAKALKQGVLPKSMLTSNYVNKFADQIRGILHSNNVMFCSKYVLSKKLDKGLESGNPVKALLNNCAVLEDIHED